MLKQQYPLTWLVEIAEVSRAGYYKWPSTESKRKTRQQRDQILKEHLLTIHRSRPFYGCPRMQVALRKEGFHVNHKRVYRLMKELNIQSVIRKKRRYVGKEPSVIHPNRFNRKFKASESNRMYVTDITYLPFGTRFFYLSSIQDLYNNEFVAWRVSYRNYLDTVEEFAKKRDVHGAILHSEQYNQTNRRTRPHGQPLSQRKLPR